MTDPGIISIEVLLQVFFGVPDAHEGPGDRDGLILEILRLTDRLGMAFHTSDRSVPK